MSVLPFKAPAPLNDDQWHTVHMEKNRKQAYLKIDDFTEVVNNEDSDLIRLLDLKSPLSIGTLLACCIWCLGQENSPKIRIYVLSMFKGLVL